MSDPKKVDREFWFRIILLIIAVGVTMTLCVVALLFFGYSFQSPVYKAMVNVYTKPKIYTSTSNSRLDTDPLILNPISKYTFADLIKNDMYYPNSELGWLSPPRGVVISQPPEKNHMAPGLRPWHLVANNYGFADDDFVKKKKPGEYRIGFFGGSLLHDGSTVEWTIARQTQNALRSRGHAGVRCMNFGYSSYVANQELGVYVHIAQDFDLDMIVVLSGCNDLAAPFWYDARPGNRADFFHTEARQLGKPNEEIRKLVQERVGFNSDAWRKELVETYLATLGRFRNVFPKNRPMVVIPQPLRIHQSVTSLFPTYAAFDAHVLQCWDLLQGRLQEMEAEKGWRAFDARTLLRNRPDIKYWDWVHFTDLGNEALGIFTADRIAPLLKK